MRVVLALVAVSCSLLSTSASARPNFPSQIPNGSENTCLNCHNSLGGGARNIFGTAFDNAANWAALCPLDTDGDEQTNGQELGDPNCVWTSGAAERTSNISNPALANDTSSDPDGVDGAEGEGEGEPAEGEGEAAEGEGEDDSGTEATGCASTGASTSFALLALLLLPRRRR